MSGIVVMLLVVCVVLAALAAWQILALRAGMRRHGGLRRSWEALCVQNADELGAAMLALHEWQSGARSAGEFIGEAAPVVARR
jgi:hypothetical protein